MTAYTLSPAQAQQRTVLANAYGGLALMMLPTAIGSYFTASLFSPAIHEHRLAFAILAIIAVFASGFAVVKNQNNAKGFGFALLFALFFGALIGPSIELALTRHSNGASLVSLAAMGTAGLFVGLASYVHITKKDFSGLGSYLYAGLWGLIIAGIANMFFQSSIVASVLSGLGVAIFSGYILHDVSNAFHGKDDNWILVALNLYMNVVNLFMNLLQLMMALSGSDD